MEWTGPDVISEADDRDEVERMLSALNRQQRAALVLTAMLGYSSDEAGDLLGMRGSTIRGLLDPSARRAANAGIGGAVKDLNESIRDAARRIEPPADWLERVEVRVRRKRRNRRILAATVGMGLSLAVFVPLALELATSESVPVGAHGSAVAAAPCGFSTPLTGWWRWEGSGADEVAGFDAAYRETPASLRAWSDRHWRWTVTRTSRRSRTTRPSTSGLATSRWRCGSGSIPPRVSRSWRRSGCSGTVDARSAGPSRSSGTTPSGSLPRASAGASGLTRRRSTSA